MELKKTKQDVHTVEQKTLFPHATIFKSMTPPPKIFKRIWRPNNYRRQFKVKTKTESIIKTILTALPHATIHPSNKLLFVKYGDFKIQYGKNILTVIFSQRIIEGEKEVFVIESHSVKNIIDWITEKRSALFKAMDESLIQFARKFKIIKPLENITNTRFEDFTIDQEIKEIPDWVVIHGEHMKKVYPDGVEDIGGGDYEPTEQLINRIKNNGLKEFAPEVAESIYLTQPLRYIMKCINTIEDVFKFKDYIMYLTENEKVELSNYIFNKFGEI